MNCPRCKGKGKMTIKVSEYGKPGESSFDMDCMTCEGSGEVTPFQAKLYKQEVEMWCSCGNPSEQSDFFEDGEDPEIGKHHWNCQDCGKVLQVG